MGYSMLDTDHVTEHRVFDPRTEKYETVSAEEIKADFHMKQWASIAVDLEYSCEDPLQAAMFFAHLRNTVGSFDIEVDVEMSLKLSGLSDEQLKALRTIEMMDWSFKSAGVESRRIFYKTRPVLEREAEREAEQEALNDAA